MNSDHFVSSISLRDEIDFVHCLDFVSIIWLVWDSASNCFLFVTSFTFSFVFVQLLFIYRLSSRSLRNHYLTLSLFNAFKYYLRNIHNLSEADSKNVDNKHIFDKIELSLIQVISVLKENSQIKRKKRKVEVTFIE
jgi:hypothetical protein